MDVILSRKKRVHVKKDLLGYKKNIEETPSLRSEWNIQKRNERMK